MTLIVLFRFEIVTDASQATPNSPKDPNIPSNVKSTPSKSELIDFEKSPFITRLTSSSPFRDARPETSKIPNINGNENAIITGIRFTAWLASPPKNKEYLYPTIAAAPTKYTIPISARIVVGIVHIINNEFESPERSVSLASLDNTLFANSTPVLLFLIASVMSVKSKSSL